MAHIQTENKTLENSLVVVSAKEHGKIYQIKNGEMKIVEYIEEHPPGYSDNEGFFQRSGNGVTMGSGAPREEDDSRNIERYIKAISEELSNEVQRLAPEKLYIFEPEHLKGLIEEHLTAPNNVEVTLVKYGNFVESEPDEILKLLNETGDEHVDPDDPASVAGEENAEEKRKILETGQMRDNM
jgi:hypothetical protein